MSGEVTKEEATGFGLNKTSQHNTVQTSDSLDFGFTPPVAKEIGGDIVVTAPRWVDWGKRFHPCLSGCVTKSASDGQRRELTPAILDHAVTMVPSL